MYYLLGIKENLKNVYILSNLFENIKIDSEETLKKAYLAFLMKIQPNVWHPSDAKQLFIYNPDVVTQLIGEHKFEQDEHLTDFKMQEITIANEVSTKNALAKIEEGIDYIRKKNLELYSLFKIVINTIFYAQSYQQGGGSISSAIGTIWCSNKKNWLIKDIIEFIVHELTHNIIFLDELRYKHYSSIKKIGQKENFVTSAILKKPRPLDKVFHSLLVAIEILLLRQEWLGEPNSPKVHPDSQQIYSNCKITLAEIMTLIINKKGLVSDRFKELLQLVNKKLTDIEIYVK